MSAPYKMKLNNLELGVTPPFVPDVDYRFDNRRNLFAERHTWPVNAYLKSSGGTNLFTKYNDLKDAIDNPPFDVQFLDSDDNVLEEILVTDTDGKGPRCTRVNIPEVNAWASSVRFSLEITSLIKRHADKNSGVINLNYTDSYETEHKDDSVQTTVINITRSGEVEVDANTSALATARTLRDNFLTSFSQFSFEEDEIAVTEDDSIATFTWSKRERESNGGSTDDSATQKEEDVEGTRTVTWSATFSGPNANPLALSFQPPSSFGPMTTRSISRNVDNGEVTVTFARSKAVRGSGVVQVIEKISVSGGDRPLIAEPVQGRTPIVFRGRQTPVNIIQNVTVRATRIDALVDSNQFPFPDGLRNENLSTVAFDSPTVSRFASDGTAAEWMINFTRTFVVVNEEARRRFATFSPRINI